MSYERIFDLTGRRAVVVGGGSGIGRECARALAGHSAHVTVADRDLPAAAQTAGIVNEETHEHVPPAEARELDVLQDGAIEQAAADLADTDILVFTPAVNVRKRMADYTIAEFDRVIALNLRASFELIRWFGARMAERGRGSIIGYSSIRALSVEPGQSVYAATKAGLVQLLRTGAAELGPRGVRLNAVAPGVVETPLTAPILANRPWYDAYAAKSALGRWAQPDELAGACVFLASDAASYVTGSVLFVDGGWTAIDGRFDPPS